MHRQKINPSGAPSTVAFAALEVFSTSEHICFNSGSISRTGGASNDPDTVDEFYSKRGIKETFLW